MNVDTRTAPCVHCPFRLSNQGTRHPDGWYTKANLGRLWAKLRRGDDMSCHPTDPSNPVSERAQAAGYKPAPAGSEVMECIGAHIVRQREFVLLTDEYDADIRRYRAARPFGLTRDGIAALVARAMFGGIPMISGRKMPLPNLNEPDVGHTPLGEWKPRVQA